MIFEGMDIFDNLNLDPSPCFSGKFLVPGGSRPSFFKFPENLDYRFLEFSENLY